MDPPIRFLVTVLVMSGAKHPAPVPSFAVNRVHSTSALLLLMVLTMLFSVASIPALEPLMSSGVELRSSVLVSVLRYLGLLRLLRLFRIIQIIQNRIH